MRATAPATAAAPAPVAFARPVPSAVLALAALTVLGALLRFALIGHQGYWFDEGDTALLVHLSPGKMLGLIPHRESTPPLYYCLAWAWARIDGYGPAELRSLSALFGVATIPVLYAAGARLCSRRAGLTAAALATCSPILVWYSQEARSYALLVLTSALTLLAFALVLERPTPRRAAAWAIAGALAFATHYYSVLAVAPEAVWLLAVHRRARPVQAGIGALAACGLALLPYAINQNAKGNVKWIATVPLARRVGQIVPQFTIGFGSPGNAVVEAAAVALVVLAIAALALGSTGATRRMGLAALALAAGGLALNLLLVAGGVDDLLTRNALAIWPAAAIAVAAGLSAERTRLAGAPAAATLCALGVLTVIGVDADRNRQKPDWSLVARALGPAPAAAPSGAAVPGRLLVIQHYKNLLPLSLYLPLSPAHRGALVAEVNVIAFSSPKTAGFCWWGSACNLHPSRLQAHYPLPGFHAVSRTRVNQFTILRLLAPRPEAVSARELQRALTATTLREDDVILQRRGAVASGRPTAAAPPPAG
jgi:hypothetical protein